MMNGVYFSLPGSVDEVLNQLGRALNLQWNHQRYSDEYEGGQYWIFTGAGIEIRFFLNQGDSQDAGFEDCLYGLTVKGRVPSVDKLPPGLPENWQMSEWIGVYYAAQLAESLEVPVHYESWLGQGPGERVSVMHNPHRQEGPEGPRVLVTRTPL